MCRPRSNIPTSRLRQSLRGFGALHKDAHIFAIYSPILIPCGTCTNLNSVTSLSDARAVQRPSRPRSQPSRMGGLRRCVCCAVRDGGPASRCLSRQVDTPAHREGDRSTKSVQMTLGKRKPRCLREVFWSVISWDWSKATALPRVPGVSGCSRRGLLGVDESRGGARCPGPQSPHSRHGYQHRPN